MDRMTATEKEWFVRLGIAEQIMDNSEPAARKRVAMIPHGQLMLNGARGLIKRFLRDVEGTLSDNDRRVLGRSFADTSYTIGIRCRATKGNQTKLDSEYCIVVPIKAIHTLFEVCAEHCEWCIGSAEDARGCKLKKALDMIPNDQPEKADGGCPYAGALKEERETVKWE